MSEERGAWGTFDNGLNLGANQAEQMAAGVNQFDSAMSASSKVFNTRMAADAALGDKLRAQGYYGHGVKAPSSPPWKLIINSLLVVALGWFCFTIYGSGQYRVADSNGVDLKSASLPAFALGQRTLSPSLAALFKPGTDLKAIYNGCKTKNCVNPDIFALDSFKRFAIHPETYENDLCNYFLQGTGQAPEQLQPTWAIDRKASYCTVTNTAALRADVASRNSSYQMKIAVFAAVMLSILIGLNLLFRQKKP